MDNVIFFISVFLLEFFPSFLLVFYPCCQYMRESYLMTKMVLRLLAEKFQSHLLVY